MKKKEKNNNIEKKSRHYEKGEIFVKIMAGVLSLLMIFSIAASLIFSLIG